MMAVVSRGQAGLLVGPLLAILMLLGVPPEGMTLAAWRTAAVGILMAIWWVTEAIPIPATALLPLVLFPVLGIASPTAAAAPFANPVIYLFLGGFIIALALEHCGLHRRLAIGILRVAGTRPGPLIFGFMLATAFVSMWVSNTATVVMMLPMATAVIALASVPEQATTPAHADAFPTALLLGIAYAANIGGLGTLIGTPPNALLAGFLDASYGIQIGFAEWMVLGVPIVVLTLPISWWLLTQRLHPVGSAPIAGGGAILDELQGQSGSMSRAEWIVGTITALTALAWVGRPILERWVPGLSDTGIAVAGALLLFLVPISFRPMEVPLRWEHAERLPWGVLILFGGGLSLAASVQESGLATWIGGELDGLRALPFVVVMVLVTAVVIFLTELTSNTATAAAFLPVVASFAIGIGADPLLLTIPTALAASCAFMMPVATPPNALVYGTGRITLPQMAHAGIWLNLLFIAVLPLMVLLAATRLFAR
jgi:sodium-dependent dicarboxylate transporter 2/3/5